jgi:hypothetical protein
MAQAEREPRHRIKLRNAAHAWLALASQIADLEIAIAGHPPGDKAKRSTI